MAYFWKRAAHSVNLSLFQLCFEGGTLVPIASVPGHCLPFTALYQKESDLTLDWIIIIIIIIMTLF